MMPTGIFNLQGKKKKTIIIINNKKSGQRKTMTMVILFATYDTREMSLHIICDYKKNKWPQYQTRL